MITYADAFAAEHFHIGRDGTPCTVWDRAGSTHAYGYDELGFMVPITIMTDDGRHWDSITPVNATDFHTPATCPHARDGKDGQPPLTGNSDRPEQPMTGGYDADGYDIFGFDADGYNREGYDADGYDSGGYDADGYDEEGNDRYGNPRPGSLDAGDLDLAELWTAFPYTTWLSSARQRDFRQHLRSLVSDPGQIDDLEFCGHCEDPAWNEDLSSAQGGSLRICDSCWSDWSTCSSCDERYPDDELYTTLGGSDVCESCRDNRYTYCEDCDGYYDDDYAEEHEHDDDGSGCCNSPQTGFEVRNDGCAPLANDTRVTITLPAGTISAEGLYAIREYLLRQAGTHAQRSVAYDLAVLGDEWQTRTGNFTKRLSRHAYQAYQAKFTPDVLSQVGCIARDHSTAVNVEIEVTRELNQSAGAFCNDGSCWWGSYASSRCALKTNGGFGLRSFAGGVSGRAWVMPLRQDERGRLIPTFDTVTPAAFVVFNGYGDLSGYAAPRIVAHMAGWTYRKIGFRCEPMYVNAGGYLVAPENIAEQYTDGSLSLSVSQHSNLFSREKELVNA
jgi:YD repeat-containing protein